MEGALEAPKQCEKGTTTEGKGIIESVLLAGENANKNADSDKSRKRRTTESRLGGSRQLVRKVTTSCDPNADGLSGSWRMYGQKYIDVDSRWPRSYYRCTHRSTHDCRATRTVQQRRCTGDGTPMYEVLDYGEHTCPVQHQQQLPSHSDDDRGSGISAAVQQPSTTPGAADTGSVDHVSSVSGSATSASPASSPPAGNS
nr:hypothetical protein [Oryza barthii]